LAADLKLSSALEAMVSIVGKAVALLGTFPEIGDARGTASAAPPEIGEERSGASA